MNNKFNVKWAVLSCLLICSVGSSAYATGTETLSTEKESTLTHNWLDRTDIKAKFQTNHEPQYAVETLQPLGHYDEKHRKISCSFKAVFLPISVTSLLMTNTQTIPFRGSSSMKSVRSTDTIASVRRAVSVWAIAT